jgi:hypothetical protein
MRNSTLSLQWFFKPPSIYIILLSKTPWYYFERYYHLPERTEPALAAYSLAQTSIPR